MLKPEDLKVEPYDYDSSLIPTHGENTNEEIDAKLITVQHTLEQFLQTIKYSDISNVLARQETGTLREILLISTRLLDRMIASHETKDFRMSTRLWELYPPPQPISGWPTFGDFLSRFCDDEKLSLGETKTLLSMRKTNMVKNIVKIANLLNTIVTSRVFNNVYCSSITANELPTIVLR